MKLYFLIILSLIIICFWSCKNSDGKTELASKPQQKKNALDKKVAVLSNSEHNKWLKDNYGFEEWTLSDKDLLLVQQILEKAIKNGEFDFLKKPIKKSIKKYYRQYIPYIDKDGDRIIDVNAFCRIIVLPPNPDSKTEVWRKINWKKEYVLVMDGGSCYWRLSINIDKRQYFDLMVNGY